MMKRVAIIGGGALGQQMAHYIQADQGYEPAGFFDDFIPTGTSLENGIVLGTVNDVLRNYENRQFDQLLVGIGYQHFKYRWECFLRFNNQIPFLTFVHSSSFVDNTVKIGSGSFIMPGCTIDNDAVIGDNIFIQIACSVSHHSTIGNNCFLGPGVRVAGFVHIDHSCFLGTGSICIDNIIINSNIRTGAGAVIIDSLKEPGLYVGIPAKKIKD